MRLLLSAGAGLAGLALAVQHDQEGHRQEGAEQHGQVGSECDFKRNGQRGSLADVY